MPVLKLELCFVQVCRIPKARRVDPLGGHLCPGCIVNTTCELVIGELPGVRFGVEQDGETGYDELVFESI